MNQERKPENPPEREALRDILELYASKADELIGCSPNPSEKSLHLSNAEAIRSVRESLKAGRLRRFVNLAVSERMLPVTRSVARHTRAINHLERLPDSISLEFCTAFERALGAEKRADEELVRSGELKRDKGACSLIDNKISKLERLRTRIAGRRMP